MFLRASENPKKDKKIFPCRRETILQVFKAFFKKYRSSRYRRADVRGYFCRHHAEDFSREILAFFSVMFCQSAGGRFFIKAGKGVPRFFHDFDHMIEAHVVFSVGKSGIDVGIESTSRGNCVALDAGNLHQASHRIAR